MYVVNALRGSQQGRSAGAFSQEPHGARFNLQRGDCRDVQARVVSVDQVCVGQALPVHVHRHDEAVQQDVPQEFQSIGVTHKDGRDDGPAARREVEFTPAPDSARDPSSTLTQTNSV